MNYKLLILDVDGTLTRSQSEEISPAVVQVILAAKKLGIKISLATGRSTENLSKIFQVLKLEDDFHVLESGALLMGPGLIPEYTKIIPTKSVLKILEIYESLSNEGYGILTNSYWIEDKSELLSSHKITSLSLRANTKSEAENIIQNIQHLTSEFSVVLGSRWDKPEGYTILITNKEANKESGIKYIQEKLNIKIEETIAIGDMPNDIPSFNRAGIKVAMGNADEKLKSLADFVTSSLDEDGVAVAIRRYILSS